MKQEEDSTIHLLKKKDNIIIHFTFYIEEEEKTNCLGKRDYLSLIIIFILLYTHIVVIVAQ